MRRITADTRIQDLPLIGTETATPPVDIGPLIAEFKTQYRLGIESWAKAGLTMKKIFDADPDAMPRVAKEANLPPAIINKFLGIGRGWLLPQLLAAPKRVRMLSIADQRKAASGTLPLVVRRGAATDVVRVDLLTADAKVCDQIVGPDGIRSADEQLVYLESKDRRAAAVEAAKSKTPYARWNFDGERVYVTHLGVITFEMVRSMAYKYGMRVKRRR